MRHPRHDFVMVLTFVVAVCCTACSTPVPTPQGLYQAHCALLCGQLQKLGCEGAQPLPDGTSCESFCIKTNEAGHPIPRTETGQRIPTERISLIQSCRELER
jgi:hypothetical protein